jgi:hypothetical protein
LARAPSGSLNNADEFGARLRSPHLAPAIELDDVQVDLAVAATDVLRRPVANVPRFHIERVYVATEQDSEADER